MKKNDRFQKAIEAFDAVNSKDPNTETAGGKEYPKELLYARRMSEWLDKMATDAPEPLKLAARCQHIERWIKPREDYPKGRRGYLKWRNDLKKYHAERAEEILSELGYDEDTINRVKKLVMKSGLKSDPDAQLLEDVVCLVFLKYYFEDFAQKHSERKIIRILQKTWRKMSTSGQEMAMKLDMPERSNKLVEKALS